MYVKQILNEQLGCSSYVVASRRSCEAAVIDPSDDLRQHTDLARDRGYRGDDPGDEGGRPRRLREARAFHRNTTIRNGTPAAAGLSPSDRKPAMRSMVESTRAARPDGSGK